MPPPPPSSPLTYASILEEFKESGAHIYRHVRGKKAFNAAATLFFPEGPSDTWLSTWTDAEKKAARGFLWSRPKGKRIWWGFNLVIKHGEEVSVLGQRFPEKDKDKLLRAFA